MPLFRDPKKIATIILAGRREPGNMGPPPSFEQDGKRSCMEKLIVSMDRKDPAEMVKALEKFLEIHESEDRY